MLMGNVEILVFDRMVERDVGTWTSMVVAYTREPKLEDAYAFFCEMPIKNTVSWTSLITGFAQNGRNEEALYLFERMQEDNVEANGFTFVSVLSADLAIIDRGKQIHGHVIRKSNPDDRYNVYVSNALIDMYCKCGDMKSARNLFEYISEKDIVSWNSIIYGFAQNGYGDESLVLFNKMVKAGVKPNYMTFISVLSACNHAGLEYEGLNIFNSMKKDHSLSPRSEHYTILIDLLGRKNKLDEAMELIQNAPNGINRVEIWGSLLTACRLHGDLDIAYKTSEALLEMDPKNIGRLVMLSNIFADAGKWDDVCRVREMMMTKGLTKDAAYSWIEIQNVCYCFFAKNKSCYNMEQDIYELIDKLTHHMKETGFSPASWM